MSVIDKTKIVATLLVVLGHIVRMYTGFGVIGMPQDVILTFVHNFIYSFHMPLFVFISGVIFFICKREKNKYNVEWIFISKKAKRLLLPYIIFSIFFVFPTMLYIGKVETPLTSFFIQSYILGNNARHLWFLLMLFNVFVILNHFELFIYNHIKYSLVLAVLLYIISYFAPNDFQISATLKYIVYFYLGYLYRRLNIEKSISKKKWQIIFILVYFLFYLTLCSRLLLYIPTIQPFIDLLKSSFGILFILISVRYVKMDKSIFKVILHNSYGIYLFHPIIIYIFFYWIRYYTISPLLCTVAIFLISIYASIVLLYVIRKSGLSIIVGENNK